MSTEMSRELHPKNLDLSAVEHVEIPDLLDVSLLNDIRPSKDLHDTEESLNME